MKHLAQLECYKPGCVLLRSRNSIVAIRQLYRSSETLLGYWDGKRLTSVWSTKNYNTSSRRYIDSVLRHVALSSLCQNQKRANFIDQHDNAPAHTARLTVNFQVANIIFVLGRPPLSQDMSAIKLLIATFESKGIAI